MAGFTEEDKNRVRAASDLVAIASDYMTLRQRGRDFWGCCPFHGEKTPSFKIDPSTQLWHCFGCGEGGDVFSFVMKIEDIGFPDAVRKLAARAGIQLTEAPGERVAKGRKARLKDVCNETASFYHMQLMRGRGDSCASARDYLASRRLNGSIPNEWELGFAPGNRALVSHLKSKGYKEQEMIEANVAVKGRNGGIQDRFFNRVMFPIHDIDGNAIAFGGRVVGKGEPKYLNSQETPIFHKSEVLFGLDKAKASLASTGTAVIVEGYTDVIVLHQAGITNAVATLGTALTIQHIRMLSRHAKHRIIYLFDGDAAGQRAADRALQFIDESMLPEAGRKPIDLCAVTLPDDLDPADFVTQRGADALNQLLEHAKPLLKYGIDRKLASRNLSDFEERGRALIEAVDLLAPVKHSVLGQEYAAYVADSLHVDLQVVLDRLAALKPRESVRPDKARDASERFDAASGSARTPVRHSVPLSPRERERLRIEREFLILCSRYPDICLSYAGSLAGTSWHRRVHALIAGALLDVFAENPHATPAETVEAVELRQPGAAAVLTVASVYDDVDPQMLASFLSEELAMRDMEQNIVDMNSQLKMNGLPEGDREMIHQSIVMMQNDLIEMRLNHQVIQVAE